jgi:hypothetical protein
MKKVILKRFLFSSFFVISFFLNSLIYCQSDIDKKEQIRNLLKESDSMKEYGKLNFEELKNFISKYNPIIEINAKTMLLSSEESSNEISIEEAVTYIFNFEQPVKKQKRATLFGWKGLKISRELGDQQSIEESSFQVPAILSVLIAKDKPQSESKKYFNFFGAIQLFEFKKDFGESTQHTFFISGGIESDIDGTNLTQETSLKFALKAKQLFNFNSLIVSGLQMQLDVFWNSDREFKRSVPGVLFAIVPFSKKLRTSYWIPADLNSLVRISWIPKFTFEFGKILDAGNNEDLQERIINLHESFTCIGFGTQLIFAQKIIKELNIKAEYSYRWDISNAHWKKYFFSLFASYPIVKVESKNQTASISFAINYRKGEKPPDFIYKNEILFGFGVTL